MSEKAPSFVTSLISGGVAGFAVDICLFPLDTIKTRLQSPHGFLKAGGFKGVYKGLSITAIGSAPGAALFFSTYDTSKRVLASNSTLRPELTHMLSASIGEVVRIVSTIAAQIHTIRLYHKFD